MTLHNSAVPLWSAAVVAAQADRSPVTTLVGNRARDLASADPAMTQAPVIPFQGIFGPCLSPDDNRLLFESVARLNGAVPSQGRAFRGMEQSADERPRHLHHPPSVPLGWHGPDQLLIFQSPSDVRHK